MRNKITLVLIFAVAMMVARDISAVDTCSLDPIDYDCVCSLTTPIATETKTASEIQVIISDYANESRHFEMRWFPGQYLICFKGRGQKGWDIMGGMDFGSINVSVSNNNHILHIHNLALNGTSTSRLTLNSHVKMNKLTLTTSGYLPLNVAGSDVSIMNSSVMTTFKPDPNLLQMFFGIVINEGIHGTPIDNVQITNTTISGPGKDYMLGMGVSISNAEGVKIDGGSSGKIQNFQTGIMGKASIQNLAFTGVYEPVIYDSIDVDITKVGKRLDPINSLMAKEILGLAPTALNKCEGSVDMLVKDFKEAWTSQKKCPVQLSVEELCIVPTDKSAQNDEEKCTGIPVKPGDCVFKCADIAQDLSFKVKFGYIDSSGISYTFSEEKVIGELGDYATLAPNVPTATGGEASATTATSGLGDIPDSSQIDSLDGDGGGVGGGTAVAGGSSGGGIDDSGDSAPENQEASTTTEVEHPVDLGNIHVDSPQSILGGGEASQVTAGCSFLGSRSSPFVLPPFMTLLFLILIPVTAFATIRIHKK